MTTTNNQPEKQRTVEPSSDSTGIDTTSDPSASEGPPIPVSSNTPGSGIAPRSAVGTQSVATIVLTTVEVYFQVYPGMSTINGTSIGVANQSYTIELSDGAISQGVTDADGKVQVSFPPGSTAKLTIFGTDYNVSARGTLEPVSDLAGVQRRLAMIGYELGEHNVDGSNGKFTEKAVHDFQCDADIHIHGRPRRQTRDTLASGTWIGE
jgi:hypothetical protein